MMVEYSTQLLNFYIKFSFFITPVLPIIKTNKHGIKSINDNNKTTLSST